MVDSVEYRRAATTLHRVGANRLFVHVLHRSAVPVELVGVTAATWLALDEPADRSELVERFRDADVPSDQLGDALELLVEQGLVEVRP